MIHHIIIWLNLNNGQYYHKSYKSRVPYNYSIGFINQYNHKIIDIIEIKEVIQKHIFLRRLLRKTISFLENILKIL